MSWDDYAQVRYERDEWKDDAACRGMGPALFFADQGTNIPDEIRAVCRACPVQTDCLLYALRHSIKHGIWGGLTDQDLRKWRRMYAKYGPKETQGEQKDEAA